jgi:hypothetical protein
MSFVCLLIAWTGVAFGTPRVLESQYTVDETESWSVLETGSFNCAELSVSDDSTLEYTLTSTVDEDNQDGTFDITFETSNVLENEQSKTGGSTTMVVAEGRDKVVSEGTGNLFPYIDLTGTSFGSAPSDLTGLFSTSAVDVNDTWYSQAQVTPYGQSQQTVTATNTLVSWTTLNGRNVAYIQSTYTVPVSIHTTVDGDTSDLTGSLTYQDEYWFDYENHEMVKSESAASGTLDLVNENDTYSVSAEYTESANLN